MDPDVYRGLFSSGECEWLPFRGPEHGIVSFVLYLIDCVYGMAALRQGASYPGSNLKLLSTYEFEGDAVRPFGALWKGDDNEGYLIFRGTQGHYEWLMNAKIYQTRLCTLASNEKEDIRVHVGFHRMFFDIMDEIQRDVEMFKIKRLIIAGHSLGGAIAILTSTIPRVRSYTDSLCVFTFGAPRVGNPQFAKRYDGDHIVCFRNEDDIVPNTPPAILSSPITGSAIYYTHVGQPRYFRFPRESTVASHALINYLSGIEKSVGKRELTIRTPKIVFGKSNDRKIVMSCIERNRKTCRGDQCQLCLGISPTVIRRCNRCDTNLCRRCSIVCLDGACCSSSDLLIRDVLRFACRDESQSLAMITDQKILAKHLAKIDCPAEIVCRICMQRAVAHRLCHDCINEHNIKSE